MVARTGRRHVEQAHPLGGEGVLLALPALVVAGRGVVAAAAAAADTEVEPAGRLVRYWLASLLAPSGQVGEHHDRELEALRAVHGEEADHVVRLLGDASVHLHGFVLRDLQEPAGAGAQAAPAGGREGARLVDDRKQVGGGLRAVRQRQGELECSRRSEPGEPARHRLHAQTRPRPHDL